MPPIWALLVSIKEYWNSDHGPVPGAPHDAENVSRYLRSKQNVPPNHIVHLADEHATREGIITTFQRHLIHNSEIKTGDALLFYYSGHGTRLQAPAGWIVDEKPGDKEADMVEAIIPYDEGRTYTGSPHPTSVIPDRTLAALINGAATQHGNNIIIVLDCCNSGHGTRDAGATVMYNDEVLTPRATGRAILTPLPNDLDQNIISPGFSSESDADPQHSSPQQQSSPLEIELVNDSEATTLPESPDCESQAVAKFNYTLDQVVVDKLRRRASEFAGIRRRGRFRALAASHVLLAACKSNELSWGAPSGGILTTLWLQFMESDSIRPRTYSELVKRINKELDGILNQHPQCEGVVRDRLIFEETMIKADQFKVNLLSQSKDKLEVEAGSAHGIMEGSAFEIYALDTSLRGSKLGTATAREVHSTASIVDAPLLQWQSKLPDNFAAYAASIVHQPQLRCILCSDPSTQPARIHPLHAVLTGTSGVEETEDEDAADLRLLIKSDGTVALHRLDTLLKPLPNPIPLLATKEIEGENVNKIFRGIARFNWLLPLTNATHPFSTQVTFEMRSITNEDANPGICKVSASSIAMTDNDIEVVEDGEYAILLHNNSQMDLFVQVWYFDPDSYSIECLYEPPNETQATLPKGGTLQLGASRELSWPLTYYVPSPGTCSTLFAKVYLTDRPIRLNSLHQDALIGPEANHDRHGEQEFADTQGRWDTILQRITVRENTNVTIYQ